MAMNLSQHERDSSSDRKLVRYGTQQSCQSSGVKQRMFMSRQVSDVMYSTVVASTCTSGLLPRISRSVSRVSYEPEGGGEESG